MYSRDLEGLEFDLDPTLAQGLIFYEIRSWGLERCSQGIKSFIIKTTIKGSLPTCADWKRGKKVVFRGHVSSMSQTALIDEQFSAGEYVCWDKTLLGQSSYLLAETFRRHHNTVKWCGIKVHHRSQILIHYVFRTSYFVLSWFHTINIVIFEKPKPHWTIGF